MESKSGDSWWYMNRKMSDKKEEHKNAESYAKWK